MKSSSIILLLLSWLITGAILLSVNADNARSKRLGKAPIKGSASVQSKPPLSSTSQPEKIKPLAFYYKLDEDARFLALKAEQVNQSRGAFYPEVLEKLARKSYQQASIEEPFKVWRTMGGPHPWIFRPKVLLNNSSQVALLDISIQVTVSIKTGEWRVDPELLLTDYDHLEKTAQWKTLTTYQTDLPVLAPGEDKLFTLAEIELLPYIHAHPNQWPTHLKVSVSAPKTSLQVEETLPLIPDHFLIPATAPKRKTAPAK
ncbi:MAG: hypothetical protein KTR14_10865 [Vampirovibrio sp.]|nr:hypothetical protein [Vampirovibrio sp.]